MKGILITVSLLFLVYLLVESNIISDLCFKIGYDAYQKAKGTSDSYNANENIKKADRFLGWAAKLDPDDYRKAFFYADNLNIRSTDLDPDKLKARELYIKAFMLFSNSDTLAYKIGFLYHNGTQRKYQNNDSALMYYNYAIGLNKNYFDALDNRARIYQFNLFNYNAAISDLKILVLLYDDHLKNLERQYGTSKYAETNFPKKSLYERLNWCNESLIDAECPNKDSYLLGIILARDQLGGGQSADCDYLYRIASTQITNINHYCFCKGVSKWLSDNGRSY
jgi:hypothetical protein